MFIPQITPIHIGESYETICITHPHNLVGCIPNIPLSYPLVLLVIYIHCHYCIDIHWPRQGARWRGHPSVFLAHLLRRRVLLSGLHGTLVIAPDILHFFFHSYIPWVSSLCLQMGNCSLGWLAFLRMGNSRVPIVTNFRHRASARNWPPHNIKEVSGCDHVRSNLTSELLSASFLRSLASLQRNVG